MERKDLEERVAALRDGGRSIPDRLAEFLELAGSAYLQYKLGLPEEKRDLLRIVTSNRQVAARKVELTLAEPFQTVANRFENSNGAPYRERPRTLDNLVQNLWAWFKENPTGRLASYLKEISLPDKGSRFAA